MIIFEDINPPYRVCYSITAKEEINNQLVTYV